MVAITEGERRRGKVEAMVAITEGERWGGKVEVMNAKLSWLAKSN